MSNNGEPLKSGLGDIQGHKKWHYSIDLILLPIGPPL